MTSPVGAQPAVRHRHAAWTRITHWLAAVSIALLAFTGVVILMAHPRLYWGEVGNDLTPALLELPISRNHRHGGWTTATPFTASATGPVSASRTYEIFNKNSWGRSLHFLAAWMLTVAGAVYLAMGAMTGHLRRRVVPTGADLRPARIAEDLARHVRFGVDGGPGLPYGTLQRWAYSVVLFVLIPLATLTGITMSPAVTSAAPFLLTLFGGLQSARTIHFGTWAALVAFALVHVTMVAATGWRRHLRAMTFGD